LRTTIFGSGHCYSKYYNNKIRCAQITSDSLHLTKLDKFNKKENIYLTTFVKGCRRRVVEMWIQSSAEWDWSGLFVMHSWSRRNLSKIQIFPEGWNFDIMENNGRRVKLKAQTKIRKTAFSYTAIRIMLVTPAVALRTVLRLFGEFSVFPTNCYWLESLHIFFFKSTICAKFLISPVYFFSWLLDHVLKIAERLVYLTVP
jgi:hypothetical protein